MHLKRLLALILAVCGLALGTASALAANILPAESVLFANAHLREGPSSESGSKMILMKGTTITVLEVKGSWLYVRYGNFTGYIRGDLVVDDSLGQSPNTLPQTRTNLTNLGITSTLKEGMRSAEVKVLQDALIVIGYTEVTADGNFGEATRLKVMEFQRAQGLRVDGVVGKETADALSIAVAFVMGAGAAEAIAAMA